ncbi:uroporphyrinogen-III synthase [Sediminicola sp. 1XM1-17]|uniref:uroporphyrinogen-III synthase n=1 Tax=Sediminicola sp. 1XM1-17 TaxID=3127702 RepID=UPI003076C282
MKTILSTKILSLAQKERLLNAGIAVVSYDAITIAFADFSMDNSFQNLIFTSQNAVMAFLENISKEKNVDLSLLKCFCVGEKTAALLEENGLKVVEIANYGAELAETIIKSHKNESFLFLCGNLRRDELPNRLRENNIPCKEITAYATRLNPKKFDRHFDGVLFFSPSGVESYLTANTIGNSTAFCIGTTTAAALEALTDNIVIANKPTIENVLVQVIKTFNNRPLESA